jgi:hypothetical protein
LWFCTGDFNLFWGIWRGPGPYSEYFSFFLKKMEYLEATNQETEGIKENQSKPTDYIRFCVHWSNSSARLDFTLCDNNIISLKKQRFLEALKLGWIPLKIGSFLVVHIPKHKSTNAAMKNCVCITSSAALLPCLA